MAQIEKKEHELAQADEHGQQKALMLQHH